MSFFRNINATPRTGTVITYPDGFGIYTKSGWREYTEKDILDNARIVEMTDGSRVDIDDIFGKHISDERVLYELILRSMSNLSFSSPFIQLMYLCGDHLCTRMLTISTERLNLDQRETYVRGWFSSHDVIRDIFEKYPDNIDYYMRHVIKYLQKLKSEGVTYKYIEIHR